GETQSRYEVAAGDPLLASAYTDKVERVVLNLLSNAFEYTPARGTVRVAVAAADGQALLSVDDSGPGVPEADRERIFERFWRGERGKSRGFAGTGLGLAICRERRGAHRGSIGVGSSPAGGARFEVRLPLQGTLARPDEPGGAMTDRPASAAEPDSVPAAVAGATAPAAPSPDA